MELQVEFPAQPLTHTIEHCYIGRDGERHQESAPILAEHALTAYVTPDVTLDFVCLPQYLPELIVGNLVTSGYLHRAEDIERLHIAADGHTATVTLRTLTPPVAMSRVTPIDWEAAWVFALADRFAAGMPVHEQTNATHSCFLAQGEELLFLCEDIGRHNAVDKAVGYAVLHDIDLSACLLYSSGRMPVDMVSKAIRAGIPVLASKGAPTAAAVSLAKQHDLTLLCAARRDRMKLFSGTATSQY